MTKIQLDEITNYVKENTVESIIGCIFAFYIIGLKTAITAFGLLV